MPGLGYTALMAMAIAAPEGAPSPPAMEAGLWEVTSRLEVPASPVQEAVQTSRHCYTREELQDPSKLIPRAPQECEIIGYRLAGNRATWSVECSGPKPMVGGGEMILGKVAYAANLWSEVQEGARTLRVTQRVRARRLGECVPEPPPPGR